MGIDDGVCDDVLEGVNVGVADGVLLGVPEADTTKLEVFVGCGVCVPETDTTKLGVDSGVIVDDGVTEDVEL